MFDLIEIEVGKFLLGAILCNVIGLLSSYFANMFVNGFTAGSVDPNPWYTTLVKPSVWPPNFVFGPVWFSLYTTMGIGAVQILESFGLMSIPFGLFVAQLFLNFMWSIIFFRWNQIGSALTILCLIDALYAVMLIIILLGIGQKVALPQKILKISSFIGCIFMLFIPLFLLPVIKNTCSSFSSLPKTFRENRLPWIVLILLEAALFALLFILNVPQIYSELKSSTAIFTILLPTMLWISFATFLNLKIKQLNP